MFARFWTSLFLLALTGFVSPINAAPQNNRTQLDQIRQRIERAQGDLAGKKQTEVKLARELTLLRQTLTRIDKRLAELRKEQRQLQRQIEQLQKAIQKDKQLIRITGKRLEKRLVALYKEGEIGPLKVLFSADSPTELVQQFQYLTRILHYDRELLEEYRVALVTQQTQLTALEKMQGKQQQLLVKEKRQHKDAKDGRQLQDRLLKHVRRDKKRLSQELAELKEKASRLQGLISELEQKPQQKPSDWASGFSSGKGKLNWPVAGKVLIGFGTKKDPVVGTLYESNGFEISTRKNEPILAVADGRVVFADWFKGYGNLLILSHPGGYHTLYAQAEKLERSFGEQVNAGELLGYSGLHGRESIYFEIRQNGAPVDPTKWLRRRR